MKKQVEKLYLQYYNQFLTVSAFADYLHIDTDKALRIVNIGRRINHRKSINKALAQIDKNFRSEK